MHTLIVKLNAAGDVVRTTTLLRRLAGEITWITASSNAVLLTGNLPNLRCIRWEDRECALDLEYDLVINLEDEPEVAAFASSTRNRQLFGAYLDRQEAVVYTDDSHKWFDLSLISRYGRERADWLKLQNRRTYQDLIFAGLGWRFEGEAYLLPRAVRTTALTGDVALSTQAGPVWPMKNWAFYDEVSRELQNAGLTVNVLPRRPSLLEHLADVAQHRCLVSGDSLPMHFALGSGTPCVTLFTCTSPWEIHDYGLQTKIISPRLEEFFYRRGYDPTATSAISVETVYQAVIRQLGDASRTSLAYGDSSARGDNRSSLG